MSLLANFSPSYRRSLLARRGEPFCTHKGGTSLSPYVEMMETFEVLRVVDPNLYRLAKQEVSDHLRAAARIVDETFDIRKLVPQRRISGLLSKPAGRMPFPILGASRRPASSLQKTLYALGLANMS